MSFSPMQMEYFRNANHRWNVKSGATRSGKTYMDYFVIPKRIRAAAGKEGLVVLLGNTKGTLQRNIIEPLRNLWGERYVTDIRADNTAELFGEKCYCLGADKVTQVNRLRGSSIKYCYGDEVVTWHPDVFEMLKSRLDKPYSKFDGTCNPEGKSHWFKKFLESDADIYCQKYTLDDNPFLSAEFVENLKREYSGTIYYDRYVLGNWVNAEGLIYRNFADTPNRYIIDKLPSDLVFATVGVDFGGGSSAHAFNCTAYTRGFSQVVTVHDCRIKEAITPEKLYARFEQFLTECRMLLGGVPLTDVYCDSAEQTLIGGMRAEAAKKRWKVNIHNARKKPINDRIHFYCIIMGADKYKILSSCTATIDALSEAMWDDNNTRLDNGSTNIDNLDAQEYSTEPYMTDILSMR